MLQKSSEQVRLCRSRAYDAHAKAEAANDPAMKADFFAMEERWLALARSYEFSESLDAFTTTHVDWRDQSASSPRAEHGDDARLQELSTMLIQEGNLDNLYGRILDAAVDLLRSKCGSMQVYLPERNELRLLAWRGFHPESAAYWQWVGLTHHSACAAALSAGRRIILADVENNALLTGTRDLDEYRRCGVRSVQTTPLRSRSGDLLGMISTLWQDPHVPGQRALRRLDVLARQAADLIERSKVEAQLRESEQKNRWLASIVNSSDDAIMSTDLAGRILSWNKGAERIFGYSAEEAIGSATTQLITPENSECDRAVLARIQAGEPFISHEAALQRKGGQTIMASLTVSPIKDAHGAIIGISSVVRDITDQKRQDEHIAVLAREAEHRTKNVLAAVQAVVNLSRADDTDGLKRAVSGRIEALAR
ncbi:MAG TPA: PAS domain S-box protein, partial [Pseudolabrys sp.]|nr:PAS domain S-box protein [Pseudolabrys sp.]